MNLRTWSCRLLLAAVVCLLHFTATAQNVLNRSLSLDVNRQRLDQVLEIMSNRGNFYFSYNSNIIKKDSLVTLSVSNKPVRQILNQLLPDHYEFVESGNYVIIRKAPVRITFVTNKAVTEEKYYTVSGYVLDDETGYQIPYASIYEKALLLSALTNQEGYFKLKLKQKNKNVALTVSKEFYEDTTFTIDPGYNQQITVTLEPVSSGTVTIISPDDYFAPEQLKLRVQKDSTVTEYTYTKTDSVKVERTSMGRFLLSAGQKFQSLNLRQFFTTR
ncbi:MAG TPA: STN and carboxypeptidase regulatory-like domain-containing protein, partial [Flavisolibacter sp.]|nr:STN and carboxypeptidase regulatory-like domain-containing protein [Flavisolibacter sp.]